MQSLKKTDVFIKRLKNKLFLSLLSSVVKSAGDANQAFESFDADA